MTVKKLLLAILILPQLCLGQNSSIEDWKFDLGYYDCLDKWVIIESTGNNYMYGYIYTDTLGFTFLYGGDFKVKKDVIRPKHKVQTVLRGEINHNTQNRPYRLMTEEQRKILTLDEKPDFVKEFHQVIDSLDQLVLTGYHFNHSGLCHLAIPHLKQAFNIQPESNKIVFEL